MVGPEKGRDRSTVSTGGELLIRRIRTEYVLDVSKRRQLRSEKSTGSEKKMAALERRMLDKGTALKRRMLDKGLTSK